MDSKVASVSPVARANSTLGRIGMPRFLVDIRDRGRVGVKRRINAHTNRGGTTRGEFEQVRFLNNAIELHDSTVAGVRFHDGDAMVMFRPAYVHRSERRPGIDPGTGWVQDIDVIIRNATPVRLPRKLPATIADGNLLAGRLEYPNIIPFPLDESPVVLAIRMDNGEEIQIQGSSLAMKIAGEAIFVEEFPG